MIRVRRESGPVSSTVVEASLCTHGVAHGGHMDVGRRLYSGHAMAMHVDGAAAGAARAHTTLIAWQIYVGRPPGAAGRCVGGLAHVY